MFEHRLQTLPFKYLREPRSDVHKEMGQKRLDPFFPQVFLSLLLLFWEESILFNEVHIRCV